jgi:hypothetical protein
VDGIVPEDTEGRPFVDTFGARFTGQLLVGSTDEYIIHIYHPDDIVEVYVNGSLVAKAGCMTDYGCDDRDVTINLQAGAHDFQVNYLDGPGAAGFAVEITGPGTINYETGGEPGLYGEFFQLRIPTENNTITKNSIYSNQRIGIELDALENWWGVNLNDSGDEDVGPNTALNSPVLKHAITNFAHLLVIGNIDTSHSRRVKIELFANPVPDPGGDPSGHGEGAEYLGRSLRPTKKGLFFALLPPVPAGTIISATATDSFGNTSEFSNNIEAKNITIWGTDKTE